MQGVMGAKNVLDDPAARVMIHMHAGFSIDEKSLATDGAADICGDFRLPI